MIHAFFVVFVFTSLFCFSVVNAQETECGANASKYPCGSKCEERCNAPGLPSYCAEIQCENIDCRCNDGFAREPDSNQCVAKSDCPVNKCAIGEFSGACGTLCEGTCESPKEPKICQAAFCTVWSCRCDFAGGFVRNRQGNCVRIEEC